MNRNRFSVLFYNNFKLLIRGNVFKLFALFSLCCILYFHILNQSDLLKNSYSGVTTLSSFIPYMNTYLYSILLVIPLIFLVGNFFDKRKSKDSIEVIYSRPESNTEYIWSIFLSFVLVFILLGFILLILASFLHLFASAAAFNPFYYFFYLFSLVLPSLVFTLGFFFFIYSLAKNYLIGMITILVMLCLGGGIVISSQQEFLNPLGLTLPGVFSEITGHSNLFMFLLQRGFWLFLGLGLVQFTVLNFDRIPNNPKRAKQTSLLLVFIFAGVFCGSIYLYQKWSKEKIRETFLTVYDKYFDNPKCTLNSQDIEYEQQGSSMKVNARMYIQNTTGQKLEQVVIYLNPALKISSITCDGTEVSYKRIQQVIEIQKRLLPGTLSEVVIQYGGNIDENICYLDVPGHIYKDTERRSYLTCRFGNRYSYLTNDYTLLIPESLWYPVTVPPVNPKMICNVPVNFARYQLKVLNKDKKSIISQGNKYLIGDTVLFKNNYNLSGISLCIGDYETKSIRVDSTEYVLNIFKKHARIFDNFKVESDSLLIDAIDAIRYNVEDKFNKRYPYSRFILTEVPITYTSYYRNGHYGSEYVQPELLFIPEKGVGLYRDLESKVNLKGLKHSFMNKFVNESVYTTPFSFRKLFGFTPSNPFIVTGTQENNDYSIVSMFAGTSSFHSVEYPMINEIINLIQRMNPEIYTGEKSLDNVIEQDAMKYLSSHSLEDAISDNKLDTDVLSKILKLKTVDLLTYFGSRNLSRDSLMNFVKSFIAKNLFHSIEFSDFDDAFKDRFALSWKDILPSWSTVKQIPGYLIKDFSVNAIGKPSENKDVVPIQVVFSIYNDSDLDGLIYLYKSEQASYGNIGGFGNTFTRREVNPIQVIEVFQVKARSGIKVSRVISCKMASFITLNTNISSNLPTRLTMCPRDMELIPDSVSFIHDIDESYFSSTEDEIIADNEDDGFKILNNSPQFDLLDYFAGSKSNSKYCDPGLPIMPNNRWYDYIDMKAYGLKTRSAMFKPAGKGIPACEWAINLKTAGKYEIFAYIPNSFVSLVFKAGEENRREPFMQIYNVISGDDAKESVIETRYKEGWVSLGIFDLVSGTNKVVLLDQGMRNQLIFADAIKWVRVNDGK